MKFFEESKELIIAGIMTGTSLDGIDIAIVQFDRIDEKLNFNLLAFKTYPYEDNIRADLTNIIEKKATIQIISEVHYELAHLFANSFLSLCQESKLDPAIVDALGIHGQTVWHSPKTKNPNSLQLGSVSALSKILNKIVVGDFRSGDIALGGEGAPLVPIFDFTFLNSNVEDRIALNIGGISNLTFLPKNCSIDEVIAFDSGPGNTLIDSFAKYYFCLNCDYSGEIAFKGETIDSLFYKLMEHPFIKKAPPKSTGKEIFNKDYVMTIMKGLNLKNEKPENIITTLTEFTVMSIVQNIHSFCNPFATIIASGGGIHNDYIFKRLREELKECKIVKSDVFGINPDAKEAICFAYLAYLTLNNLPGNIPSVTGAKKRTVLGVIALPD